MDNFLIGLLIGMNIMAAFNVITSVTPEQACRNLKEWKKLFGYGKN